MEGHRFDFITVMNSHRFHKVFVRSQSKANLNHIASDWKLIECALSGYLTYFCSQRLHNSVTCAPVPDLTSTIKTDLLQIPLCEGTWSGPTYAKGFELNGPLG